MHFTLARKVSILVGGVIVLAVLNSIVALLSSWHVGSVLHQTVNENLPSVRAAEELEIALLEQRGCVSYYILDGNRKWLSQLQQREGNFHEWLSRARETARSPEQWKILRELEDVYAQYHMKRGEVVALYDRGDVAAANKLLRNDANLLYDQAYELCESFITANERFVDTAADDARRQIRWVSLAVSGCAALTVFLSAALLWLFYFGVAVPVRAMAADARSFVGGAPAEDKGLPTDELRAVGIYLRNLMSDMADARTTLERSRRQLRDAEKLASVGKLAASVAHEIRNPLTAIKMWLFSIQKEVGGNEALDKKFEMVAEEIRRLENIVRGFLEFSRPPEMKLSVESISTLLDKTLELMEPRIVHHKIKLVREESPNLPAVLADWEQIRQVLVNLLNNAAEASGQGGQIKVVTTTETDADGRRMVVVRVCDTGPGMPEEVAQRIFEPFFSTKDHGVGLGLCIAARIMVRHEGRLALESSGEEGTTFAIHIPAAPGEAT